MALFDSHWNEDDRIPQERGLRAKIPVFEDNWEADWKEIFDQIHQYFDTEKYKETYEKVASALNAKMLDDLWPKMTWERKIDRTYGITYYVCSHCGSEKYYQSKYCSECGAMEVTDD